MSNNALLIGSPVDGLQGTFNDVQTMKGLLGSRGFTVRTCVDEEATREGILDAYRGLIHDAGPNDAVVVYYSGHGSRVLDRTYSPVDPLAPRKRYHQFIVPVDIHASKEEDFRGILNHELSWLQTELTEKTRNVTVILDCCHSGGMSRALSLRPKWLARTFTLDLESHLEKVRQEWGKPTLAIESNPYAVRVAAAGPNDSAFEHTDDDGNWGGFLTVALRTAFEEAGQLSVPWSVVESRVQKLVQDREVTQRPVVEGPADRFLFTLKEADLTGVLPVIVSDAQTFVQGGRILGIEVGDEYDLMPKEVLGRDEGSRIGSATVTEVEGARSRIEVAFEDGHDHIPPLSLAFPARVAHEKRSVKIRAEGEAEALLRTAFEKSSHLRVAGTVGEDRAVPPLAIVEVKDGKTSLLDLEQNPWFDPWGFGPEVVKTLTENLTWLARARAFEVLKSGSDSNALEQPFSVEWGRVVDGDLIHLERRGALLLAGDRIFVRITNNGSKRLFASLFDVGVAGKITLLSTSHPDGVELKEGEDYGLGYRETEGLKGWGPLYWPKGVSKSRPRDESLMVLLTDQPQNLRSLETPGMAKEGDRSNLQQLMDQFASGTKRDCPPEDASEPDVRYAVHRINFSLAPVERASTAKGFDVGATDRSVHPMPGTRGAPSAAPSASPSEKASFLLEDLPGPELVYLRPKSLLKPPSKIAIRLRELVVHSNRSLGSGDVRVDAMVLTGAADEKACFRAATERFQRIRDGDHLPLENLLVYLGPASGFIDLAVWVSRDDEEVKDLAELLATQLSSDGFKTAALALAGLAVAAPQAAAIVAGIEAASGICNIAYGLLSKAVGKSIGLYRTSQLASENFGVGRHPPFGLMKAQDFSFSYEVVEEQ